MCTQVIDLCHEYDKYLDMGPTTVKNTSTGKMELDKKWIKTMRLLYNNLVYVMDDVENMHDICLNSKVKNNTEYVLACSKKCGFIIGDGSSKFTGKQDITAFAGEWLPQKSKGGFYQTMLDLWVFIGPTHKGNNKEKQEERIEMLKDAAKRKIRSKDERETLFLTFIKVAEVDDL